MKGDKAVFTALKTSARATLPRAINTNNGDDTSVGAKQSLTHSQRTTAKKIIGRSVVRQATLGRRLESALKIALKVYEALIARHGHQKSADNKH